MKRPVHVIVGVSGGLGFRVSCVVWGQFVLLRHPFFHTRPLRGKIFKYLVRGLLLELTWNITKTLKNLTFSYEWNLWASVPAGGGYVGVQL